MKQVVQNMRSGETSVLDVPQARLRAGGILVQNVCSLISAGTEKSVISIAKKSLVGKAMDRPDRVKQVLQMLKTEGFWAVYEKVQTKLSAPLSMGYSAAGIVKAVGEGVTGVRVGDRVACAGTGYAAHVEEFWVPKNLFVPMPDEVSFEHAAFCTVAAIALQGVRLVAPTIGETVVVMGLGLVGQITVQLLKANGCRVIGADLAKDKVELAGKLGADDLALLGTDALAAKVAAVTGGRGADAVIITASTPSSEPVEKAGEISRPKGRVVVVGAVGLELPREPYYLKEINFAISMSYGPGRYDPEYEEKGHDYPFGYVRWTEQRNLEAVLELVRQRKLDFQPLISHRYTIGKAEDAYALMLGKTPYLGILLDYPEKAAPTPEIRIKDKPLGALRRLGGGSLGVGFVGAGSFAQAVLLPKISRQRRVRLVGVATGTGMTARAVGDSYGFSYCTTESSRVLEDKAISSVFIATRHDSHASLVCRALDAGKHVFVEKPLSITREGLEDVRAAHERNPEGLLLVGFNRRFSPGARQAREFFARRSGPLVVQMRVNAGFIPSSHWTQDEAVGGGRILGEGCHFFDLLQYIIGSDPVSVYTVPTLQKAGQAHEDNVLITCRYADGSIGSIAYLSSGDKALAKERLEIFGESSVFQLEDFVSTRAIRDGKGKDHKLMGQDKGHAAEIDAFFDAIERGGPAPIPFRELYVTSLLGLCAVESLRTGAVVTVPRVLEDGAAAATRAQA